LQTVSIFLIIGLLCAPASAQDIPQKRAVDAIIGEAESLGYSGMFNIACAIRNRGHLRGVYGERAPRVVKRLYSAATRQAAVKAWALSATADTTKGADHWASKSLDRAWEAKMIKAGYRKTYEDKGHVFYKSTKTKTKKGGK
jgi:hypothetical protein